jgi:hypothetical protein
MLAGCDSGTPLELASDSNSVESSERDKIVGADLRVNEIDVPQAREIDAQTSELIRQGVSLANQALPGHEWSGNTHLPLSAVAPQIDELDVMELLLKFEDHYKTDVTMADLAALIGRENIEETRHHLTLESISLLIASREGGN